MAKNGAVGPPPAVHRRGHLKRGNRGCRHAPTIGTRQMGGTGPFGCFGTTLSDPVLIVIGPADPDVPEPDS